MTCSSTSAARSRELVPGRAGQQAGGLPRPAARSRAGGRSPRHLRGRETLRLPGFAPRPRAPGGRLRRPGSGRRPEAGPGDHARAGEPGRARPRGLAGRRRLGPQSHAAPLCAWRGSPAGRRRRALPRRAAHGPARRTRSAPGSSGRGAATGPASRSASSCSRRACPSRSTAAASTGTPSCAGSRARGRRTRSGSLLEKVLAETTLRIVILDPNSDYVGLGRVRDGADRDLGRAAPGGRAATSRSGATSPVPTTR